MTHPYLGEVVALATKHAKERAIAPALQPSPGMRVTVAPVDTDRFGTFTGETERPGPPSEVAQAKARMGALTIGVPRAIASEGSFGPHPALGFAPAGHEILAFVDEERGIELCVQRLTMRTNVAQATARSVEELDRFLRGVRFPCHGVIVRPNVGTAREPEKGLRDPSLLRGAICRHARDSDDGLARVESDMRAHMNPTRMREIALLARELARRLSILCPACQTPGWGVVDVERGLPCGWCGQPTDQVAAEIEGCAGCPHRRRRRRPDARSHSDPGLCEYCNP